MTPFFYDTAIEQYQFSETHPLKPQRLTLLRALMEAYGLTAHLDWQTPPAIDESELRRVHTPEYIEVARQLSAGAPIMDAHRWGFSPYGDNPPFVGMWEAALAYTRATLGTRASRPPCRPREKKPTPLSTIPLPCLRERRTKFRA